MCLSVLSESSCELLSKVDIFDIRNNRLKQILSFRLVVNCSQKLISLIFGTTSVFASVGVVELWIALKSWYLWYSEQRSFYSLHNRPSCELLSKVDIFDIRNNVWWINSSNGVVVNCSQKLISLIFGTTIFSFLLYVVGCELLSKVDIFDIRNNDISQLFTSLLVVNCSQKLISLIFGTTDC